MNHPLLITLLVCSFSALGQSRVFLGEEDIIEPKPVECKGMVFVPEIVCKMDTVVVHDWGKTINYVNDSSEIFGNYHYNSNIDVEFNCDRSNDCRFWLAEYNKDSKLVTRELLIDTAFAKFQYTLDGIEMGYFSPRIKQFLFLDGKHVRIKTQANH